MTLTINSTRIGGWGFSDVAIEAFAIPTTCKDACGFPGGLGETCKDRCGIPNGLNECVGCDGVANSKRKLCAKWTMNLTSGNLAAKFYGANKYDGELHYNSHQSTKVMHIALQW